jgi:hypothetical protein
MDEFVEVRREEGPTVQARPGSPRRGRTDPARDGAQPDTDVRHIGDAQLEELGILEALSGA